MPIFSPLKTSVKLACIVTILLRCMFVWNTNFSLLLADLDTFKIGRTGKTDIFTVWAIKELLQKEKVAGMKFVTIASIRDGLVCRSTSQADKLKTSILQH